MVSTHALENARKYLNPQHTTKAAAMRFQGLVNAEISYGSRDSVAIVLVLDKPVDNDYRDNWAMNDRLVGIIRKGSLVTVMLSRKNQINKNHLRTDRVVYA